MDVDDRDRAEWAEWQATVVRRQVQHAAGDERARRRAVVLTWVLGLTLAGLAAGAVGLLAAGW